MKITKLNLVNFRKHQQLTIDTNSNSVVIVGDNASGKTSIIEAIYYSCFFTSFRIRNNSELITFDQDVSAINLSFLTKNQNHQIDTYFNKEKRNIVYNGNRGQKRTEMLGVIKVLLLSPNSDELVSSSPRVRRSFLDMYISQYNPLYRQLLRDYQKLVKIRNASLKANPIDQPTLEIITQRYDVLIAQIVDIRIKFLEEISILSNSIVEMLSQNKDQISLEYRKSRHEDIKREIKYGKNMYGLQFDDFDIILNNNSAKRYASQGQKRSIAMALILSQIELIYQKFNQYPIVIIDDVHIELDNNRQQILFQILSNNVQAFFISTNLDNIPSEILNKGIHYKLENNVCTRLN